MPEIKLNATAAQATRIQAAVNSYNAQTGENLTVKQWVYLMLRVAVVEQFAGQASQAAESARAGVLVAIEADMQGGT